LNGSVKQRLLHIWSLSW